MKIKNIFFSLLFLPFIWSCEDVIDFNLRAEGKSQLVVDAWLTNLVESQKIILSFSQPYFDNSSQQMATGAKVYVIGEDKRVYQFIEAKNEGVYEYLPESSEDAFSEIGKSYQLFIEINGEVYSSVTRLNRVPVIDSIRYEFFQIPFPAPETTNRDGYIAEFYAKDFPGIGDTYWVTYSRNGIRQNSPSQITLAYDAGFSPGSQSDGLTFIRPIRRSINAGSNLYQEGDELEVSLYSISNEAFFFLSLVRQESSNGGIFAVPSGNIPSNILNVNNKSSEKALGFFCVSAVSKRKILIEKDRD